MFIGHINTRIDAKGRVVVPAQFRKELAGITSLVARMSYGDERYLMVFTEEDWKRRCDALTERLDEWNEDDNETIMKWTDQAVYLEIDAQGRLLIPKAQKERMGVQDELTFAGMGKNFAIWDSKQYEDFCARRGQFTLKK